MSTVGDSKYHPYTAYYVAESQYEKWPKVKVRAQIGNGQKRKINCGGAYGV
jgi:hypothetical protein